MGESGCECSESLHALQLCSRFACFYLRSLIRDEHDNTFEAHIGESISPRHQPSHFSVRLFETNLLGFDSLTLECSNNNRFRERDFIARRILETKLVSQVS